MDDAIKVWKKEGLQEGKLNFARSLLADGIDVDKIIQYTGLTKEEIQELKIADRN